MDDNHSSHLFVGTHIPVLHNHVAVNYVSMAVRLENGNETIVNLLMSESLNDKPQGS